MKRSDTTPEAQRELDAAAKDYGTPAEREERAAQSRAQLGHARTNGNTAAGTWKGRR